MSTPNDRTPLIPLEDTFVDVVQKAIRGQGLTYKAVSEASGISVNAIESLLSGGVDSVALRKIAAVLRLNPEALIALATGGYPSQRVELPDGVAMFNSPYGDMTVNAYLVWDSVSRKAAAFDTGADCSQMLAWIAEKQLVLERIFLTHTHRDHVAEVDCLVEKTKASVFSNRMEPFPRVHLFLAGDCFQIGALRVSTRLTAGHSVGGTTYLIEGLSQSVALVGDALFAGSMGGGAYSYPLALRTNRLELYGLADDTIVGCGHGPVTTIGREKKFNPFYLA